MGEIRDRVREAYSQTARAGAESASAARVAAAFGYRPDELARIPEGANLGLSCGNPVAAASIRPGETVLDLGSGGGLDVFLAAAAVGDRGRAIGVDMTADMVSRARARAAEGGYGNVEFRLGEIEALPLGDASVDCIISNCVLNLSDEKPRVYAEMFRVLKPGGRLAISDIALKGPLDAALQGSLAAYVGCVAGAVTAEETRAGLIAAGFADVLVVPTGADLNAYQELDGQGGCCSPAVEAPASGTACCGGTTAAAPETAKGLAALIAEHDLNRYAETVSIYAIKP